MNLFHAHTRLRNAVATLVATVAACVCLSARAQVVPPPIDPLSFTGPDLSEQFADITIEQKLDSQLDLDLPFTTSEGQAVKLRDLMDGKPAILSFVYYECPQLCQAELSGMEIVIKAMKFTPGDEYNIITLSIDPEETPEMAAAKKATHVERVDRPGTAEGWHFLVGNEYAIAQLAQAAGFKYVYDPATDMYAHAAGIMAVTPDGRVARYFYGLEYIKRDVEWGLTEASDGRIGNLVDQMVLLCFQYDPKSGAYGIYVIGALRVLATLTILGLGLMYLMLYLRSKKATAPGKDADDSAPDHGATSST